MTILLLGIGHKTKLSSVRTTTNIYTTFGLTFIANNIVIKQNTNIFIKITYMSGGDLDDYFQILII